MLGYSGYIQTCEYVDFLPSPAVVVLNDCCNKVHGDNKAGVLKLFLKVTLRLVHNNCKCGGVSQHVRDLCVIVLLLCRPRKIVISKSIGRRRRTVGLLIGGTFPLQRNQGYKS